MYYDVLIIGARIAGSATAIRLAELGYKVCVVDRATRPSDVLSTHFMNPRGMTYLKKLGVLDTLLQDTPAFEYFDVQVDDIPLGGKTEAQTLMKRLEKTHPEEAFSPEIRYACIRRPLLDGTLQQAARNAGAEINLGTSLIDINGVTNTATLESREERREIRAKVIIGADGSRSHVAKLLRTQIFEERLVCTFACYSYFDGLALPRAVMKRRSRLSFAAVPTSFGKTMVLVFGPSQLGPVFVSDKENNFYKSIAFIDASFADYLKKKGNRAEPLRFTADQNAFLRKRSGHAIPLIGDAASFKDQCTASGMTHALRDAFLLSSEIHQAFSGKKHLETTLNAFEERRYLDHFPYYEFTAMQAEMNPLRAHEERLYRAISDSIEERNRFIGLYFDIVEVKDFFRQSRVDRLVRGYPLKMRTEKELLVHFENPLIQNKPDLALEQTCFDYVPVSGSNLLERVRPYFEFYERRRRTNTFQYSRTLHRFPGTTTRLSDDSGKIIEGINFASQDYLGLGQDPEIRAAAIEALDLYGPHSAGSPMIIGNTLLSQELEEELKRLTGKKYVLLFPTGFAAGFGSIVGIVKAQDYIVMDRLSHACLQQGARAATRKIMRYAHLDVQAARAHLREIRSGDTENGILLITEGLFSMDADSPDLRAFQDLAHEFKATLFVDVAHDLGATGPRGQGQIGIQGMYGKIDLVMGSFSKTFAANGGFLATDSEPLLHYLKMYSAPHLFSNALSPVQTGVALKAAQIIQSKIGDDLRERLNKVVSHLRNELTAGGLQCIGNPSPIVSVFIGREADARLCHAKMMENQVAAMIIEYPVVPLGATRFRLQVMASHSEEQATHAARVISRVVHEVQKRDVGSTGLPSFVNTPNSLRQILPSLTASRENKDTLPCKLSGSQSLEKPSYGTRHGNVL